MHLHERTVEVAQADETATASRSPAPRLAAGLLGIGVAALLAACAGPEGPSLAIESARDQVERVAADPVVTRYAPLELKQARDTVEQADRQWREDGDREEAQHDAYLATQRATIAANLAHARASNEQLERTRLDAENKGQLQQARREASEQAQRAEAASARAQELESRLREIEAQRTERGLLVTLGDVLFETGQSDLLPSAFSKLDKLAQFLRDNPERRLLVEGYTDSTGSDSFNLGLSQRRAESVHRALVQRGVDPGRITTRGYGENYPVADNSTAEGRALNRRVEVVITDAQGNLRPRA